MRICNQSLEKNANKPKQIFLQKFNMGIKISSWFQIRWKIFLKNVQKKLLAKTWQKYTLFSLLLIFVKLVLLITFFGVFFYNFFNGFEISMKLCVFLYLLWFFPKYFLGHISNFFILWSQTRKKRHQKSKNVLSKCVLNLNFAPTHQRICVLNFLKKSRKFVHVVYMSKLAFGKMFKIIGGFHKNVLCNRRKKLPEEGYWTDFLNY
jgi:hypothetical protein